MEGVHGLTARAILPAALLAAALALPAQGRAEEGAVQACLRIDDDAARLACFDRLHGRSVPPPRPALASSPPDAVAEPSGSLDGPGQPTLQVREAARAAAGPLTQAWLLDGSGTPFRLVPYRPIYILPLSATDNINRRPDSPAPGHSTGVDLPNRSVEAKFQISAKTLAWEAPFGDLWIAYTQSSRWQLYQGDISRPFRETNYEPEIILNRAADFGLLGWRGRMVGLSLSHQSNGRALPLSRSWNRVIGHIGLERDAWSLVIRPWFRIRESADQDDNPDIEDHMGRADLTLRREGSAGQLLALRLRHSLRGGDRSRGSAELDWAFPLTGRLHGFVQLFSGYGESMIDYNIRQTRLGVGLSLAGWH